MQKSTQCHCGNLALTGAPTHSAQRSRPWQQATLGLEGWVGVCQVEGDGWKGTAGIPRVCPLRTHAPANDRENMPSYLALAFHLPHRTLLVEGPVQTRVPNRYVER